MCVIVVLRIVPGTDLSGTLTVFNVSQTGPADCLVPGTLNRARLCETTSLPASGVL